MKHVTFIKLGGAVITNKDVPNSIRMDVVDRLVDEIARARNEKNLQLVIGNGQGSFAHIPAHKYQTMNGFIDEESRIGMAITQDSAAQSNRILVGTCIKHGIPALTVAPSNSVVTKHRVADSFFTDVLEEYIDQGMLPVLYGDVIVDRKQGCTIWSTDKVFSFFARQFVAHGWQVDQIIHVTEAQGVWKNAQKEIYTKITPEMKDEIKAAMGDVKGTDVTGGMWHKIEESLSLTVLGIQTRIIGGLQPNALYNTLCKDSTIGTTITV